MNRKDLQTRKLSSIWPGVAFISGVIVFRLMGVFEHLEWASLDLGLRLRPSEPVDEHLVIVGIEERDIQSLGTYPISDQSLADLLTKIQAYQPRAIGLDIFRDLPVQPGHEALQNIFASSPNLVAIERILPDMSGATIPAPPSLPDQQVGFVDALLDTDGFLRRSLLGANPEGTYRFSFTLRLAQRYLDSQGIALDNGIRDPVAMRFGTTELHRVHPNTGGYSRVDAAGNQILLNFRSGPQPFRQVSLQDIQNGNVNPDWLRDRIVLLGITAASQKDLINTSTVAGIAPGVIHGVEVQAHAISQIVNAVLENRPLLQTWPDGVEYGWMLIWGGLGIGLGYMTQTPKRHFAVVLILITSITGGSYLSLLSGLWLPLVPTLIAFVGNGIILYAFQLYDQSLKARIRDRQMVIERSFDTLHNGPLQTLAALRSEVNNHGEGQAPFAEKLQALNEELREMYEAIRQETLYQGHQILLSQHLQIELEMPLDEILSEVYYATLARNLPCFHTLKVNLVEIQPFITSDISLEQKRDLARFLQEALCNVGKHAIGVTTLAVSCKRHDNRYELRIEDNGSGTDNTQAPSSKPSTGRGTHQARSLARRLHGKFRRYPAQPTGTVCELSWPAHPTLWQRLWPRRQDSW